MNEYLNSILYKKINKKNLAFLDIDNTLTGRESDVNKVRETLEKLGFCLVLVSARTEEMLMSTTQYKKSKLLGFKRPPPKLNKKKQKFYFTKVEEFEPKGIIDPEIIIGSSGTTILIKQKKGGYLDDQIYKEGLNLYKNWRKDTLSLLKTVDYLEQLYFLGKKEFSKNYKLGLSNILTPEYRIQVDFKSLKEKDYIYNFLQKNEKKYSLNLSDDSDARVNKYSIYITPKGFSKGRAVNHVINRICQTFSFKREDFKILFAGDSLADLDMGFLEKGGADTTLLIVGGSRLSEQQIKEFTSKISGIPPKRLIIGDSFFPHTKGPQTILSLLQNSSF